MRFEVRAFHLTGGSTARLGPYFPEESPFYPTLLLPINVPAPAEARARCARPCPRRWTQRFPRLSVLRSSCLSDREQGPEHAARFRVQVSTWEPSHAEAQSQHSGFSGASAHQKCLVNSKPLLHIRSPSENC